MAGFARAPKPLAEANPIVGTVYSALYAVKGSGGTSHRSVTRTGTS